MPKSFPYSQFKIRGGDDGVDILGQSGFTIFGDLGAQVKGNENKEKDGGEKAVRMTFSILILAKVAVSV